MNTRFHGTARTTVLALGAGGVLLFAASCGANETLPPPNAIAANGAGAAAPAPEKEPDMDLTKFEALLLARDWTAIDQVGALGPAALPPIDRALHSSDPEIRQLAVLCLEHIKGPRAAELLVRTFDDPDEQIRAYAADMLRVNFHPSVLPAVQTAMARHGDPRIRAKAALVVGLIGDKRSVEPVKQALATEAVPMVRDCLQQAMARLGDADARSAILRQLTTHDRKSQFEAVEKVEYVNDPALVRHLAPLLEDSAPIMALADSGTHREVLRVKDAAAKVIAVLLRQPFSFQLQSYRICSEREIEEIRDFLRRRPVPE